MLTPMQGFGWSDDDWGDDGGWSNPDGWHRRRFRPPFFHRRRFGKHPFGKGFGKPFGKGFGKGFGKSPFGKW